MKGAGSLSSVLALLLSLFASSHHWLHMAVLLLLGGSGNAIAAMSSMLWLRRIMIAAACLTVAATLYRLIRHSCLDMRRAWFPLLSALLSLGFVAYTLAVFGW